MCRRTSLTWIERELRLGKPSPSQRVTIQEANDRQVPRRLPRRSSRVAAGERRRNSYSKNYPRQVARKSPAQRGYRVGDMRTLSMRGTGRRFVYILRSESDRSRHYVGIASHPNERLHWHNDGPSCQTLAHRPWSIVMSIEFPTEQQGPVRALSEVEAGRTLKLLLMNELGAQTLASPLMDGAWYRRTADSLFAGRDPMKSRSPR
jgi:predicted GIY-YIG superfamily endonuclease